MTDVNWIEQTSLLPAHFRQQWNIATGAYRFCFKDDDGWSEWQSGRAPIDFFACDPPDDKGVRFL